MAQSLSKVYLHLIFHIRTDSPSIKEEDQECLYAYLIHIMKDRSSDVIAINGMPNHIHILFIMPRTRTIASVVEDVKKHSSRWVKTLDKQYYAKFSWQNGYAIYSVSESAKQRVSEYIRSQKEHHLRISFEEEYLAFIRRYEVSYDDRYLWTD